MCRNNRCRHKADLLRRETTPLTPVKEIKRNYWIDMSRYRDKFIEKYKYRRHPRIFSRNICMYNKKKS